MNPALYPSSTSCDHTHTLSLRIRQNTAHGLDIYDGEALDILRVLCSSKPARTFAPQPILTTYRPSKPAPVFDTIWILYHLALYVDEEIDQTVLDIPSS